MSEAIESISQGNYILHNIDAKKLYVQEPLFTANSGDAVYVGWRPDETVLYSGAYNGTTTSYALNDNITNFEKIKVYGMTNDGDMLFNEFYTDPQPRYFTFFGSWSGLQLKTRCYAISNNTAFNNFGGVEVNFGSTSTGTHQHIGITKVIGVNRKENA